MPVPWAGIAVGSHDERLSVAQQRSSSPVLPSEFSHPELQALVKAGRTTGVVRGSDVGAALESAGALDVSVKLVESTPTHARYDARWRQETR